MIVYPAGKSIFDNLPDGIWYTIDGEKRGPQVRLGCMALTHHKPSAAILDSQSVKTVESGADYGYDAGKKITGRKRHLVVDTLG